jgi:hypothetical protein
MSWDPARNVVVLTGGAPKSGPGPYSGIADTWSWNGTDWTKLSVGSPGHRFLAPMAYDSQHGVLVRYGGISSIDERGEATTNATTAVLGL